MKIIMRFMITMALLSLSALANDFVGFKSSDTMSYKMTRENAPAQSENFDVIVNEVVESDYILLSHFLGKDDVSMYVGRHNNRLYVWNAVLAMWELFVDFDLPVGTTFYNSSFDCHRSVKITAKNQQIVVSGLDFDNVARLDFDNHCQGAGVHTAYFAPRVGLIQWIEGGGDWDYQAGDKIFSLIKADVNGVQVPGSMDIKSHFPNPMISIDTVTVESIPVELSVVNNTYKDVTLYFVSGQEFDIELKDTYGQTFKKWSSERYFDQGSHQVVIPQGGEYVLGGEISLQDQAPSLISGQYELSIFVTGGLTQQTADGELYRSTSYLLMR